MWKNGDDMSRSTEAQRDHVDRFLETIREELPELDLTVEGIVDRINGLSRRIKRLMDETLTEHDLTWGEWKVLGLLRRSAGVPAVSPGTWPSSRRAVQRGDDEPARPPRGSAG